MKIAVLTVEERLYLPAFFERFLRNSQHEAVGIFKAPLRHGKQSTLDMILKYFRTFGLWNTAELSWRELWARMVDSFPQGVKPRRFYSIASVAESFGVPCTIVEDVNSERFHQQLLDSGADIVVSVTCPQIFRKGLIELLPKGCLNMHGAILPNYRGLAPSFWMMKNGEKEAGVTVFFVNEDVDAGDVIECERWPILEDESLEAFIVRSKQISCDVLLRALDRIEAGGYETTTLDISQGSYYGFPARQDYLEFRAKGRRLWGGTS